MTENSERLTPEKALKITQKAQAKKQGKLKIIIGYAPGVGKTYSMLNEGNRRLQRGENIMIGYLEDHNRIDTNSQVLQLQVIPPLIINYNNREFYEVDVEKILEIKPDTILIDELAHTNAPTSKNNKRYIDIQNILEHNINVITTLNIQHLESLNDIIKKITSIQVNETIPDKIVQNADEIIVVDITPHALQNRLKRGDIYSSSKISTALDNFFKLGNLGALREIALRQTAQEVEEELIEYLDENNIKKNWHTVEKIMVCIGSAATSKTLIRRGIQLSKRFNGELYVVNIKSTHPSAPKSSEIQKKMLEENISFARNQGATIILSESNQITKEILKIAQEAHITQLIIGHTQRTFLQKLLHGNPVNQLLKLLNSIEIHIVPQELYNKKKKDYN